jgi:hypothetical protein
VSDVLEEAEALLVQLPDALVRRKFGQRLSQSAATLANGIDQVARIKALWESAQLINYGRLPEQKDILDEMVDCATAVGRSIETAVDAEALRSAEHEYKEGLVKAIVAVERAIVQHWRALASDKFQPLIGLGKLLTAMNIPNELGKRLEECGAAGLAIVNTASATERLRKMKDLLTSYQLLQEERTREIGNDEVGDFINALAEQRATLAMVTPNVLAWLTNHDALANLGITTYRRETPVAGND